MRPVSIPQIGPPNIHWLGAAKNRRAPADALEKTPTVGSAAVLGRINVTTDPTTRLDQANAVSEHSPAGDAQTTCLSPYRIMKSPVRGACLRGTKLSNGTLWVTNPTRQRLTTSRNRVLRSCQQWQHEAITGRTVSACLPVGRGKPLARVSLGEPLENHRLGMARIKPMSRSS